MAHGPPGPSSGSFTPVLLENPGAGLFAGYTPLPRRLRRAVWSRRRSSPRVPAHCHAPRRARAERARARAAPRGARPAQPGRHVLGLRGSARRGEDLPALPHPPDALRGGLGPHGAGLEQRVRALGLFLDDVYGDQRILKEERVPRDARARLRAVPEAGPRPAAPGRRAHPHRGRRHHPRSGRDLPGPRGQPPHAVRRLLRPGEPAHQQARPAAPAGQGARAAGRPLPGPARRDAALGVAREPERHERRRAHAGALQLGLFRAQLPRAHDGARARAGPRPVRRSGRGLLSGRRAALAGSTSSTAASTRRSSTPRPSAPTACSACAA